MENDDTVILNPARQSNLARAVAKPRQRWQRKPRARARASVIQHSHKGEDPEDGTARTTMTLNVESESHLSAHEVKELERIVSEAAGDIKGYVRSKTLANRRASRFTAAIAVASIALIALFIGGIYIFWSLTDDGSRVSNGGLRDKNGVVAATSQAVHRVNMDTLLSSKKDGTIDSKDTTLNGLRTVKVTMTNGETRLCVVEGYSTDNDGSVLIKCQDRASLTWTPTVHHTTVVTASGRMLNDDDDDSTVGGKWWSDLSSASEASKKKSVCVKVTPHSECSRCVENNDAWCSRNTWDSYCHASCKTSCKQQCKDVEVQIASVTGEVTELVETEPEQAVDCMVTAFGGYDPCKIIDETCVQSRNRTVNTFAAHGGAECPSLIETVACPCPLVCGDGRRVKTGEQCDDGNVVDGDGCSAKCKVEAGWRCEGTYSYNNQMYNLTGTLMTPSVCVAQSCGDGHVKFHEQCDDGNTIDGDGCSAKCTVEPFYDCSQATTTAHHCIDGESPSCLRIRRDYADLSANEKDDYLYAINALKIEGTYDKFVKLHAHLKNKDYAHGTSAFLPWHRKFLLEFENALRALPGKGSKSGKPFSCMTVPYWDWSEEVDLCVANGGCKTFDQESVLLHEFGGTGNPNKILLNQGEGFCTAAAGCGTYGSVSKSQRGLSGTASIGCLTTGPFAGWVDHEGYCLTRGTNWNVGTSGSFSGAMSMVDMVGANPTFGTSRGFRARFEGAPHAMPHNLLGGHIRSFRSPADPIFFSHHAMIDKIWSAWQDCHDHDAVAASKISSDEYERTTFGVDGLDDKMELGYPLSEGTSGGAAGCDATKGSACATCVGQRDAWCSSNTWDSQCSGFCDDRCKTSCGGGSDTSVQQPDVSRVEAAGRSKTEAIGTWDGSKEWTPRDFHSIHDLGYAYAADHLDDSLTKITKDVCNMKFENTISPARLRRLNEAKHAHATHAKHSSRLISRLDRQEYERFSLEVEEKRQRVLVESNGATTGTTGEGNTESKACTLYGDTHWQCKLDKVGEYFYGLLSSSKAASILVLDSQKVVDSLPKLKDRECKILYDRNIPVSEEPDVRWWAMWGMLEHSDVDVLHNPCAAKGVYDENGTNVDN